MTIEGVVEEGQTLTAVSTLLEAIEVVKTLCFTLRPAQLDMEGLSAAVRSTATRSLALKGLRFSMRVTGDESWIDGLKGEVALRVLQEALTNTLRHAQASEVRVRIRFRSSGALTLTYADDGCGFNQVEVRGRQRVVSRLGLLGMQERCELIGGRLRIRSSVGVGTVVRMDL